MIRFTPPSDTIPEPGKVLLAEPFMADAHFGRKAILLCEHNEEGSFGFVLNNFIEVGLNELIDDLPAFESKLSLGGPVKKSNLFYLHTIEGGPDSIEIKSGLHMGGDFEWVKEALRDGRANSKNLRFFIGYSGWTPGQLLEEVQSHSWFITDASVETIMKTGYDEELFWRELIGAMGSGFDHIANAPADPSLN